MKELYEKDQVFGIVGNVGTPTAAVALPYALERRMLFFGRSIAARSGLGAALLPGYAAAEPRPQLLCDNRGR